MQSLTRGRQNNKAKGEQSGGGKAAWKRTLFKAELIIPFARHASYRALTPLMWCAS